MKPFQPPTTEAVSRRWVSIFLFLAVFFLALHYHVATAVSAQITKECSCLHGSRTQAGLTAPSAGCVPVVAYQLSEICSETEFVFHAVSTKASRAPPSLVSL